MPSPRVTTKYNGILKRERKGTYYFHISGKYHGGYKDIEVAREDQQMKFMVRDTLRIANLREARYAKAILLDIIVDDDNEDLLKETSFYLDRDGYPSTSIEGKHRKLHQLVYGPIKIGNSIDHIDGNTLDNRRDNLREVSPTQNAWNRKINRSNTTGYRGVSFCKISKKYKAAIVNEGEFRHLGYHETAEQASEAYEKAYKELRGNYGRA